MLGLALVREEANPDDPDARHFWFGDAAGSAGTLVSFLEYPELESTAPGAGSTHHFALAVSSNDELDAWRDYLRARGVECTDVFDRGALPLDLPARPRRAHRRDRNDVTRRPSGRRAGIVRGGL